MKRFLLACGLAAGLSMFSFGINEAKADHGRGGGGYGSYYGGGRDCGRSSYYGGYHGGRYGGTSLRIVPGGYPGGYGYSSYYGGGFGSPVVRPYGGFGPAYGSPFGSPIGGFGYPGVGFGRGISIGGGGLRINF